MDLEVRLGARRIPLGVARDLPDKLVNMKEALRTLAELTAAGLFSLRGNAAWEFQYQFHSPADWREFIEKPTCGGVEVDRGRLETALGRPDGYVLLTEKDLASVYERT
jgi:hypothetical protein